MNIFVMTCFALLIDLFVGEPEKVWDRYPHPVTLMGRLINWFDEVFNTGEMRKAKGFVTVVLLVLAMAIPGFFIQWLGGFWALSIPIGLVEVVIAAVLIAHNSLVQHVEDVADALDEGLVNGRSSVAMIVGRDSADLDQAGVARSAIESAAENFSDGVVAPVFWFLILGLPGILIYKIVNTADSMIGYENPEYGDFGFATAKLDDVLNFIPARITAALIAASNLSRRAVDVALEDADLHRSPNAGWPEAAMAGALNIALSGPRSYEGKMTIDPFVNQSGKRDLTSFDIRDSIAVLNRTWIVMIAVLGLIGVVFWLI